MGAEAPISRTYGGNTEGIAAEANSRLPQRLKAH
jgi:hypothetical protein